MRHRQMTTSTVRPDQLGQDSVVAVVSHGSFEERYVRTRVGAEEPSI
jgi:hypothetical protein